MGKELDQIIDEFDDLRKAFLSYRKKQEPKRDSLIEFEARFVDLKTELRLHRAFLLNETVKRDEKAASAIKFRIAVAIHEGEFKNEKGELIYDACSINQAEKFAAGSIKYKEFIDQRAFYKQSYLNVSSLHSDIEGHINLIKDILKYSF